MVCIFFFWILLSVSNAQAIRKCCPDGQILDQWHGCVPVPPTIDLKNTICGNAECQFQEVGLRCPQKQRQEFLYSRTLPQNLRHKGCVDLAFNGAGGVEGPILITCDISPRQNEEGFVTKCCPIGQSLDADLKSCVRKLENIALPFRMFRDKTTGLSTNKFHWKIFQEGTFINHVDTIYWLFFNFLTLF